MPSKRKVGRPQKITMEIVDAVAKLVAGGMTVDEALLLQPVEISPDVFRVQMNKRKEFATTYARMKAERMRQWLEKIETGGSQKASGPMWLLERMHPDRFGRKAADVSVTAAVAVGWSDEDMKRVREAAKRAELEVKP